MQQQVLSPPVSIFCSAAAEDNAYLKEWEKHLSRLQQIGYITFWSSSHLMPGQAVPQEIEQHLESAYLFILLLSPDFFLDQNCQTQMEFALHRHQEGSGRVIPLVVRPVAWRHEPVLGTLSWWPSQGEAIESNHWKERHDEAFNHCINSLLSLLGRSPGTNVADLISNWYDKGNRQSMLNRLQKRYPEIQKQRLDNTPWMELSFTEVPNAVEQIASVLSNEVKQAKRPLAQGTSLLHIYDKAEQELLILGEPGVGKSTLMIDLATQLVERAKVYKNHPLPIIFYLSSWAIKRLPLQDWLSEQLAQHYGVPWPMSKQSIQAGFILPLLDGLDEMTEPDRPACIKAINTYRLAGYLHPPLVVCSRQAEYTTAAEQQRLALHNAVVVQPLTTGQVDTYLSQQGESLTALRRTLKQDSTLEELAKTPLMLSTMTRTYQGTTIQISPGQATVSMLEQQVWHDYIKHMVEQKQQKKQYTLPQISEWLGWLARQTRARSQTIFYIENLQSSWLASKRELLLYEWLAIRTPGVLVGILISLVVSTIIGGLSLAFILSNVLLGGLLGGIFSGRTLPTRQSEGTARPQKRSFWSRIRSWLFIGSLIGLVVGFISGISDGSSYTFLIGLDDGLNVGITCILLCVILTRWNTLSSTSASRKSRVKFFEFFKRIDVRDGLITGFLLSLTGALSVVLSTSLSLGIHKEVFLHVKNKLSLLVGTGLSLALVVGLAELLFAFLIFAFIAGFTSRLLTRQTPEIRSTDQLNWSWRGLRESLFSKRHLFSALWFALLIVLLLVSDNALTAVIIAQVIGMPLNIFLRFLLTIALSFGLVTGLIAGLANGVSFWALLGLAQGIKSKKIDDRYRIAPNQGIRRSASNGLKLGGVALIVGAINGFWNGLLLNVQEELTTSSISNFLESFINSTTSNDIWSGVWSGLRSWFGSGWELGLSNGWSAAWLPTIVVGISVGVLAALFHGWFACLRHYTLRLQLWRAKSLPWRLSHFLDEAASCHLLRKPGGGYEFYHRSLLNYFADREGEIGALPSETNPPASAEAEPSLYSSTTNLKTGPFAPTPSLPIQQETQQLLPCGHLCRANVHLCSICGKPCPPLPVSSEPLPITSSPVSTPLGPSFGKKVARWLLVILVCLTEIVPIYLLSSTAEGDPVLDAFVQSATVMPSSTSPLEFRNTVDYHTVILHPATDNHPKAIITVTQNWNPNTSDGVDNPHPVGVIYDGPYWFICNEDGFPIRQDTSFNIAILEAGPSAFVQVAKDANGIDNYTVLDNPRLNNHPDAIILVTQNLSPGGRRGFWHAHPVGVRYNIDGYWSIIYEDGAPMTSDASFNVQIVKPSSSAFVHHATSNNIDGNSTDFSNQMTDGQSSAMVFVTQNWNSWEWGSIYNMSGVGVKYTGTRWSVFNEDGASMRQGASFNILILPPP